MDARREYGGVLAALGGGAALVLLALQPTWVVVRLPPVDGSTLLEPVAGSELVPWLFALGLLALAGCVGVVATRGVARRAVGAAITVAGLVTLVSAVAVLADPVARALPHLRGTAPSGEVASAGLGSLSWWWPALAVVGGLLVTVAGVAVVAHGSRWPVMAGRYDAPLSTVAAYERRRGAPADPWRALDRGEDPTLAPGETADDGRLPE